MKIYMHMVSTRIGTDVGFASTTQAEADRKLAAWCREYWKDRGTGPDSPAGLPDREVIECYFQENNSDFYYSDTDEVETILDAL